MFGFDLIKVILQIQLVKRLIVNLFLLMTMFFLSTCGKAYFPIELKIKNRSDRLVEQEEMVIKLIPMTEQEILIANQDKYERKVIQARDLKKAALIVDEQVALAEVLPVDNDPGPYVIGNLDVISIVLQQRQDKDLTNRQIVVSDSGHANFFEIGKIKVSGLTQVELEDEIYRRLIEKGFNGDYELAISGFNSKSILVYPENKPSLKLNYINSPMYLRNIITSIGIIDKKGIEMKIELLRGNKKFTFSKSKLLQFSQKKYRLFPDDKIFISSLNYKPETVLVAGETGAQRAIPISHLVRPTLSETIFNGQSLNNITSDFSQIYVIREKNNNHVAYHLDITNPARITLSSKFEMRPNDIIFVATQPLSLYSRTLSQILGSTGLTIQARDTLRTEFGN